MTILDEFHRNPRRVLDRLVDGELGTEERRQLLAALDDEPGGWRSCALAFLEAQSWRWQLGRMAAEPLVAQLSAPKRSTSVPWGTRFLALAAGLLVAFGLGTLVSHDHSPQPVANVLPPDNIAAPQDSPSEQGGEPSLPVSAPAADTSPAERRWQMLTLKPVGNDDADPIQVRVVDEAVDDPAKLLAERTPLTATFARELEQAGWQVDRRQQWLPIELTDGRQVIVPVEEIDLRAPSLVPF